MARHVLHRDAIVGYRPAFPRDPLRGGQVKEVATMELMKFEPRGVAGALERQVNRLFKDFFGEEFPIQPGFNGEGFPVALDITETPEALVVTAEVPGIDPKEVQITVRNNLLTLQGEKKEEKETKGKHWHRVERRTGSFSRTVQLPVEVEPDKVEAASKNGVLTVTLPKSKAAQGRQIPVKAT
jgi:HSP20 family protein